MAGRGRPASQLRAEAGFARELRAVARDRRTGARGLAERSLRALSHAARRWRSCSPAELHAEVRQVADLLASTQPAMGIFRRWSLDWQRFAGTSTPSVVRRRIARWIRGWSAQLRNEAPALQRAVRRSLPAKERILTISRSASVRRALTGLPRSRRPREVIVLESRPGGEGRRLARDLRWSGLTVRLVPDAEGTFWVRTVDRVVLGADTIYADGSVAHKVGTRRLALAAHRRGIPVIVIAGASKSVTDRPATHRLPPLFDLTPAGAITAYWTDRAVVKGGHWRALPLPRPTKISRTRA